MKTLAYVLILLSFGGAGIPFGRAQEPAADPTANFTSDARSAYLSWQQAKRDADLAYVASLRVALDKATRQGQLDEAVAIQSEIKRVTDTLDQDAPEAVPLAEFLVGTSWVSSLNGAVVALGERGQGKRLHRGTEKAITYQMISETEFSILWPVGASAPCVMAADRKSFASGEVTWKRKSGR